MEKLKSLKVEEIKKENLYILNYSTLGLFDFSTCLFDFSTLQLFNSSTPQLSTALSTPSMVQGRAHGLLHQGARGSEAGPDFKLPRALRHQHFEA